jgi:hypothetical protein
MKSKYIALAVAWLGVIAFWVAITYLITSCAFLPTLRHPRSSQGVDFTKQPAEIPEYFDRRPL